MTTKRGKAKVMRYEALEKTWSIYRQVGDSEVYERGGGRFMSKAYAIKVAKKLGFKVIDE